LKSRPVCARSRKRLNKLKYLSVRMKAVWRKSVLLFWRKKAVSCLSLSQLQCII
jgi:hypothetical protein